MSVVIRLQKKGDCVDI